MPRHGTRSLASRPQPRTTPIGTALNAVLHAGKNKNHPPMYQRGEQSISDIVAGPMSRRDCQKAQSEKSKRGLVVNDAADTKGLLGHLGATTCKCCPVKILSTKRASGGHSQDAGDRPRPFVPLVQSDRSKLCCWAARSPLNRFEHKPLANTGLPFLLEAICCRTSCNRQLSLLSTANNLCDYSTNTTLTLEQIVWAGGLLKIGWKANLHHSHGEKANTNGTKKMDRKQAAFPHSSPPVGFSSPLFAHTAVEAEVSRGEAFF